MKSKFTIGVFAAIFDSQSRILCVKRNYSDYKWTTPGGGMESGESPIVALAREIKEETGYIANQATMRQIGIYSSTYKDDIVISIRADIIDRTSWTPNNEIAEVRFFHKHELPDMKITTKIRINDAFSGKTGILRVFNEAP